MDFLGPKDSVFGPRRLSVCTVWTPKTQCLHPEDSVFAPQRLSLLVDRSQRGCFDCGCQALERELIMDNMLVFANFGAIRERFLLWGRSQGLRKPPLRRFRRR